MQTSNPIPNPTRPLWREPFIIGLVLLMGIASVAVLMQGQGASQKTVDPTKPAAPPGGGSFCDTPAPVKSTSYNPSTRHVE